MTCARSAIALFILIAGILSYNTADAAYNCRGRGPVTIMLDECFTTSDGRSYCKYLYVQNGQVCGVRVLREHRPFPR